MYPFERSHMHTTSSIQRLRDLRVQDHELGAGEPLESVFSFQGVSHSQKFGVIYAVFTIAFSQQFQLLYI